MIYLDNASTTFPKPKTVPMRVSEYLSEFAVSHGRSNNRLSKKVDETVGRLRNAILSLLDLEYGNVFFTLNATHSANVVLKGKLSKKAHVIICNFSHNAVLRPIHHLSGIQNTEYNILNVDQSPDSVISDLSKIVRDDTELICMNHVSNVIGVKTCIESVIKFATDRGIATLVDSTQSLGTIQHSFRRNTPDYIIGTGHKSLMGPTGVGFIYAKNPDFDSLIQGGTGYNSVSPVHPLKIPDKYEAGTQNFTGIVGLLAGIGSLTEDDTKSAINLRHILTKNLLEIPEVELINSKHLPCVAPIVAFNIKNAASLEITDILESRFNIAVRGGLHCAPLTHRHFDTFPNGSVRVSLGKFNTIEEINSLIFAVKSIISDRSYTKIQT